MYKKIHSATKKKELPKTQPRFVIDEAREKGIISDEEYELIHKAEDARVDVVQVDEFTLEEYQNQLPSHPKFEDTPEPEVQDDTVAFLTTQHVNYKYCYNFLVFNRLQYYALKYV